MSRTLIATMLLTTLSVAPLAAHATVALQGTAGGGLYLAGSDQLYGWQFAVNSPVSVTALGVFDLYDDGLAASHAVGIYRDSDQALLISATLPAGTSATLLDGYRYVDVASTALATGSYTIVMTMPPFTDPQLGDASSAITAPEITYITSAIDFSSSSLAYPNPRYAGFSDKGLFGPNFQFSAAAVPAPASLTLFGLGLAGFGLRRRTAR